MSRSAPGTRRAGILVPLFSVPSSRSWGIGEFADLPHLAAWLRQARQRILLMLPLSEMPLAETSPYSSLSAMALSPQFIALDAVEDFHAIGGEAALEPELRARLEAARQSNAIDYANVRDLKEIALRRSFARFQQSEWARDTPRAASLRAYIEAQVWWLDDYALFRALQDRYDGREWRDWPDPIRTRDVGALAGARAELADEVLYGQYVQWIADQQWADARAAAHDLAVFGDLPFAVGAESADVWAHQDEFRLDLSIGVPPDAFSDTGQDWRLPAYRWDVLASRDFSLLRQRARRLADLFDGCRVDHLVGFFRMYTRPMAGGPGMFTPAEQWEQQALGERILDLFLETRVEVIAEDLGVVPDFVRESLTRLAIPGYKVFRWERHWHSPGQPFRDPVDYSRVAVATSGTHDTEPLVIWWENAPEEERRAILEIASVRVRLSADERAMAIDSTELPAPVRDALLEALYASGADLLVLPIQDVFGWRDRINQPATVGPHNWTWKLPWPSNRLLSVPEAVAAANRMSDWAERHGR
jgi:4-alpha-glucanotransferase